MTTFSNTKLGCQSVIAYLSENEWITKIYILNILDSLVFIYSLHFQFVIYLHFKDYEKDMLVEEFFPFLFWEKGYFDAVLDWICKNRFTLTNPKWGRPKEM